MIFPILDYLAAAGLFILALRSLVPRRLWPAAVLAGSLAYLAVYDYAYGLGLAAGLTAFWGLAGWMDRASGARKKRVLALGIAVAVAVLASEKYAGLARQAGNSVLALLDRPAAYQVGHYAAPLGMSYYSFRLIHYLVERYRGRTPKLALPRFLLYLGFFPSFAAGPIERSERFVLSAGEDAPEIKEALRRIGFGLFKCLALGAPLGKFCRPVLAAAGTHPAWVVWLAVYAQAFYIYLDFAGYTDIAIGTARLMGYRLMENFDRPYLSASPAEFWRRWHMSLSFWLRDYVYIPLGGSRAGRARHYLNYLAVMTVCGMWHGSEGHFVLWGVYHGIGLVVTDLVRRRLGPGSGRAATARHWLGVAVTFHFVVFGWLIFFDDLDRVIIVLARMFKV